MAAVPCEIQSFMGKFEYLTCMGYDANLSLNSYGGRIYIDFRVNLGAYYSQHGIFQSPEHPLPSRSRRRRRRHRNNNISSFNNITEEPSNSNYSSTSEILHNEEFTENNDKLVDTVHDQSSEISSASLPAVNETVLLKSNDMLEEIEDFKEEEVQAAAKDVIADKPRSEPALASSDSIVEVASQDVLTVGDFRRMMEEFIDNFSLFGDTALEDEGSISSSSQYISKT